MESTAPQTESSGGLKWLNLFEGFSRFIWQNVSRTSTQLLRHKTYLIQTVTMWQLLIDSWSPGRARQPEGLCKVAERRRPSWFLTFLENNPAHYLLFGFKRFLAETLRELTTRSHRRTDLHERRVCSCFTTSPSVATLYDSGNILI